MIAEWRSRLACLLLGHAWVKCGGGLEVCGRLTCRGITSRLATGRQPDATWPTRGLRIAHARRDNLHRWGYSAAEDSWAAARGFLARFNSIDLDVRPTGCEVDEHGHDIPGTEVLVVEHWDLVGHWEGATLDGHPFRGRVSQTPWSVLQRVVLQGKRHQLRRGRHIHPVTWYMARARSRFGPSRQLMFEAKARIPEQLMLAVHQHALDIGSRFGWMALPENLHDLAARGPAFGMLLTRGRPSAEQWAAVDGAKGSSHNLAGAPAGKRLLGPGRGWGGSRIS